MRSRFFQLFMLTATLFAGCYVSRTDSAGKRPVETQDPNVVVRDANLDMAHISLADMLRRVPGVSVGSDNSIQIRGATSLFMDTDPLFVVDGTPVGTGYSSVSSLNPNDVASIRVLKGSDASLYGVRGANGVILIKLKH